LEQQISTLTKRYQGLLFRPVFITTVLVSKIYKVAC